MPLSPAIAIHLTSALSALACGPIALWARKGRQVHPVVHRAFGYAWVTCMLCAALSALFIHDRSLPHVAGYSWIHLFGPATLLGLVGAFRALAHRNIARHRQIMQGLYLGGCWGAGLFALLPGRFLGRLVWGDWLGFITY